LDKTFLAKPEEKTLDLRSLSLYYDLFRFLLYV
jgi:hypothetical protein